MSTFRQLAVKESRHKKKRRCVVAALKGAPQRRAVVMKMGTTTPKKPNSAKRKFVKVGVLHTKKVVFAHPPGTGQTFIQEFSTVMIEGGSPPDVPGINYTLIRGIYDFCIPEKFGRKRRRSKFGAFRKIPDVLEPKMETLKIMYEERLQRKRLKLDEKD